MKQYFRFKSDVYVLIVIGILLGIGLSVAAMTSRQPGDYQVLQGMAFVLCYVPSLLGLWFFLRARITTDERGIEFRGLSRSRFYEWEQVEDFGWDFPRDKSAKMWLATLWVGGKKKRLSPALKGLDELRAIVAERATKAPAREWGRVGARDCDTQTYTFVYRDTPNWQIVLGFVGFTALMVLRLTVGGTFTGANLSLMWGSLSWWQRPAFVGVLLFHTIALPALMAAVVYLQVGGRRRFTGQSIVANPQGLEFWNGPSRLVCSWNEIERFELEPARGSLQLPLCALWARGQKFEWHSAIENGRLLRTLVAERAVNAQTRKWNYRSGNDGDTLGGELSFWPSGIVGVGPKRYHYRTRSNRALLALSWTMFSPILFTFARTIAQNSPSSSDAFGVVFVSFYALLLGVLSIGGLCAYLASWLERDEKGLVHKSLFGRRAIAWSDVQRAVWNGQIMALEIRSAHTTIRVGPVADLEGLMDDIKTFGGVEVKRMAQTKSTSGESRR